MKKLLLPSSMLLLLLSFPKLEVLAQPVTFSSSYHNLNKEANTLLPETIVSGKVATLSGDPLPGVTIVLKNTNNGTTSNADGSFSLPVPENKGTLVFSFIGYQTQEVLLDGSATYQVKLSEDVKSLEEVVVVGYGTQKKVNVTGALATVDKEVLANRPITNSTQALQNLPGVYTNQTKGRPGDDNASIRIRGVGTLNNNNPLVLVDGVEFPLNNVNPNDIESITVLKDAASAAIYGNRAANGVILVKTKSGQKGKFQVDYNYYYGQQEATQLPDVVTNSVQYMEGKNRALANEGKPAEYSQALIDEYKAGTDPIIYPNTNWFDIMFRQAAIQEHNLRFSGGSDKTVFSLSLGYLNQEGIMINTWGKRYSINTNVSADISKKIKVGANLVGTYWNNRESAYTADEGNGEGGILGLTFRGLPMQTPYAQDGSYSDQWIRVPGHNFFRNTVALSNEGFRKNNSYRTLANVFAEVELPFNIRYKTTAAANILYGSEKYSYPQINLTHPKTGVLTPIGNVPARGLRQTSQEGVNLTNFHTLSWDKTLGNHQLTSLLGFSVETFNSGNFTAYNQGYLGNELTELNAGSASPQVGGTSGKSKLASYFGRVNYNFQEKYLLEANFRYDGSSRFAQGNRWGFFPSFSAGWRISEENFLKNQSVLSNLKLRASYGRLGNQDISLFSYLDAFSLGQNYSFNNTVVSGAAITQISDENITWESTAITDVGLEGGLFTNRFTFELDWFNKKTTDILRQVSVPAQVGNLIGPFRNIGSVSNKGIEVTLGYRDKLGDIRYNLDANVTYLKNGVLDLNGQVYYNGNTIIREGEPISSFFGLQADGIFQSEEEVKNHAFQNAVTKPGDIRYKDIDDNQIIDNNDRVIIGNSIPKYTYGFSFGAGYKNVDVTAIFQGVKDVDTYLTGNLAQPYKNGAGITPEWLTDSWTPENLSAPLPRLTTSNGYPQNFQTSSFWIRDASYLRLKNVQVSYSLPAGWSQKVRLQGAKLFVNAQNYLTFTKFKFSDPERNVTRGDLIEYPNTKILTAGVNLSF